MHHHTASDAYSMYNDVDYVIVRHLLLRSHAPLVIIHVLHTVRLVRVLGLKCGKSVAEACIQTKLGLSAVDNEYKSCSDDAFKRV